MPTIQAKADAYITDEKPSYALGSQIYWPPGVSAWERLWVAEGGSGNICKFLIDFDLTAIPANSIVTSAKLRFFQYDGANDWISSTHSVKLAATLIDQSWTAAGVTWNTQPTTDGSYISPETASFYNHISTNVEIEVTAITQQYVANQASYFGYMVYYTGTSSETRKEFRSMDYSVESQRPVLIITYIGVPEIINTAPVWDSGATISLDNEGVIDSSITNITISWGTATDPESDPIEYVVSRRVDNAAADGIYNGTDHSFTDDIVELLPGNSVRYIVYPTDFSLNGNPLTSNVATISRFTNLSEQYTYLYDIANPNAVKKLIFTNNPSPTTNTAYLTFQYNPVADISFLKAKAEATNLALSVQNTSLYTQKNSIGNDITNISTNMAMYMTNKATAINTFESNLFSFIKEGPWNDSGYVLKRIKTTILNPALTLTATPTSGFLIPLNSKEINFTTIKLWLMNGDEYLYKYEQFADYTIEYGVYNGQYGIFFNPLVGTDDSGAFKYNKLVGHDTRLSAVTELFIECYDTNGVIISTVDDAALPKLTIDSYTRTYLINDFNPQLSSLEIVTQLDKDFLVENTDYTFIINEDNTGTITFKPSQNALHLSNYYSIAYYNNTTVKSFYADAEDALIKAAYPSVNYEISMKDLSVLPGFETFIPTVGRKILINDSDLKLNGIYGFISEISYDLDSPENTKITITNYENIGKAQQILIDGGGS